jgi:hypothetical protein
MTTHPLTHSPPTTYLRTTTPPPTRSELAGSPFVVTVSDGAVAPLVSHAYGIGLTHTTAGVDAYFTVQARDAAGNNRTTGGDVVVVTVVHERTGHGLAAGSLASGSLASGSLASGSLAAGKEPVAVAYLINGSYRVRYNATRAGNTTVSVTINGVHVDGSPFLPYVSPTVAHAAHCHAQGIGLVSASAASASGSGSGSGGGGHGTTDTTVSNVTVYARDRFGNLLDRGGDQFVVKLVGPTMFFVRLQDMGRLLLL